MLDCRSSVLEIVILDERSIANLIQNKCLSAGWKLMTTIVLESGDGGLDTRMNDQRCQHQFIIPLFKEI